MNETPKSKTRKKRKGFTLVEVLIAVGAVAVIGTVAVLIINPAEVSKETRDSKRLSDISTISKALAITGIDNLLLGNINTIYVSMPDISPTCDNLGLPIPPSGWSYACATSANLKNTNGTGWIPINLTLASNGSPLSTLPVDPVNNVSSNLYYTYVTNNTTWTVKTQSLESVKQVAANPNGFSLGNGPTGPYIYPTYWVPVPGNEAYGTSDFYVMKYDAKCVQTSSNTPLTSPDTGSHTYSNSAQPCTGSSYYVASTPDGYPIANIDHNTALSYCASLGTHLLTNDEYMTIVRNAEQVNSNWSGGSPGSGYMYSGHNDDIPPYALTADPNDANGYFGTNDTSGNQRRTLTLSNGSVVWDFAGNVWQHVQRSVNNVGDLTTTMALPARNSGFLPSWSWAQYGNSTDRKSVV